MKFISIKDIADQVRRSLPGIADGFDVDGIVDEVILRFGRVDINDIDVNVYWDIVSQHDMAPGAVEDRRQAAKAKNV
jgi:hypothetical protein